MLERILDYYPIIIFIGLCGYVLITSNLIDLAKILISNSLNLVLYGIITILFLSLEQGHVLPILSYTSGAGIGAINIILFHALLFFLAMIMSLYPNNIFNAFFSNASTNWKSKNLIITYEIDESKVDRPLKKYESKTRKFFGALLFIVWSWIIISTMKIHHHDPILYHIYRFFNLLISLLLIYFIYVKDHYEAPNDKSDIHKNVSKMSHLDNLLSKYLIYIIISIIIALIITNQWNVLTISLQIVLAWALSFYFYLFRANRLTSHNSWLNDHYKYLHLHSLIGFAIIGIIISINISPQLSQMINPINILVLYLITFYTVIILPLKYIIYLNKSPQPIKIFGKKISTQRLFNFSILFVLGLATYFNQYKGNDLHNLTEIPRQKNYEILQDTFLDQVTTNCNSPILYAAYGGGLKANYWNLLILDTLDQSGIFKDIVSMSGVSGGGMGIALFSAIKYNETVIKNKKFDRKKFITTIGQSNILGLELPWLFGWDFLRESLPNALVNNHDRSYRSMSYYTEKLGNTAFLDSSMYKIYYDLYKANGFYPNIIFNSTSTMNKYGVVSPITTQELFPGADKLLNLHDDNTLGYLEAVSTCNRFPIISPAARVSGKGYYLDGGYFENSGILSLISFKKFIENSCGDTIKYRLVSVRNSKELYLDRLISNMTTLDTVIFSKDLPAINELSAVIKGAINVDRLPNYIEQSLGSNFKGQFDTILIDLPYYIDKSDLSKAIGKEHPKYDQLWKEIEKSNQEIRSLLNKVNPYYIRDWGIINPPTSRVLSEPVRIYMKAMMDHSSVKRSLQQLR